MVPRALAEDYVVCAAEVGLLRAVEAAAVASLGAAAEVREALVDEVAGLRAAVAASERGARVCAGRTSAAQGALLAERDARARAERSVRWWRAAALVGAGAAASLGVVVATR